MAPHPAAASDIPIVCDMTTAPDTGHERLDEYGRLFARHLLGRGRTDESIRFRFRVADGVEPWIRSLAERERACCPFFRFTVTRVGDEIHWDSSVVDDETARAVLTAFYDLPLTFGDGVDALQGRLEHLGFEVVLPQRHPQQ